ncbi:hypothetical protein ANN_03769 [Periplaneta americana]|uniref:Per a allergen n=1 Tax=Periplaneta americana TaxID=6978 RepID=A0ABQ8U354_PERAM|nr:hypothetical protein ANN_03769 [Periplaneta americana]
MAGLCEGGNEPPGSLKASKPLEKELKKRLKKCFVWSVALYGAETWTLRRSEEERIEAFEMWIWRRMELFEWFGYGCDVFFITYLKRYFYLSNLEAIKPLA